MRGRRSRRCWSSGLSTAREGPGGPWGAGLGPDTVGGDAGRGSVAGWDAGSAMAELHSPPRPTPASRGSSRCAGAGCARSEGVTVVDGFDELALAVDAGRPPAHRLPLPRAHARPRPARAASWRTCGGGVETIEVSGRPSRRWPTARDRTGSSPSCPPRRPTSPGSTSPAPAVVLVCRGRREARQPRRDAAHGRRRRGRCRRRGRPGDRLGQPQRRARQQGHRLRRARCQRRPRRRSSPGWRTAAYRSSRPPRTPTSLHTDVDYRGPVAVAVGTEKHGLTEGASWRRRRPGCASPWRGGRTRSTSAISAAVVLYEAVRQRRS